MSIHASLVHKPFDFLVLTVHIFCIFSPSLISWDSPRMRFEQNTGKYGPEKTPYLDTFHTVKVAGYYDNCKYYTFKSQLVITINSNAKFRWTPFFLKESYWFLLKTVDPTMMNYAISSFEISLNLKVFCGFFSDLLSFQTCWE